MVDELQSLLDRIQREGVEQAEAEAERILREAKEKAREIVSQAEKEATERVAKADEDSVVFVERGTKALEQAARDMVIGVQKDLESIFVESVRQSVGVTLTPETMAKMMIKMSEAYGAHELKESRIDILLNEKDRAEIVNLFMQEYRSALGRGIEIHAESGIKRGFKVSFRDDKLYHDFTVDAIAEALAGLLKSPLREIVKRAAG
ncbi:MAG: hypothetical protein GXX83_05115 [Gaiellales bacterium]|nr:hypothetical protein [Gaiellales bacterium]